MFSELLKDILYKYPFFYLILNKNIMSDINKIASKHLGQLGSYAIQTDTFDSSLLIPMPRELARKDWGITGEEFVGYDVWHCHEATFLLSNGVPVAGTLKIVYPASSKYMVESKSIKLYLNSFDMCKMGVSKSEAIENYKKQIIVDLSKILECEVKVGFFTSNDYEHVDKSNHLVGYVSIDSFISKDIQIDDYKAQKHHLEFNKYDEGETGDIPTRFCTNVLRSRCRHTKQKDTGEAYLNIICKKGILPTPNSMFKQIVSLRMVDEFHEFCAEKLYTDFTKHSEVEKCCIMLLYSRRGSLDINPIRATNLELIPKDLVDVNIFTTKTQGQ